ncbi:MAG: TVP38/TMEM64 family protein [Granulosicoccus sp.]
MGKVKNNASTRSNNLVLIALIALLAVIITAGILFPPAEWVPVATWGESLQAAGLPGLAAFFMSAVLATAVGFPRQMVAFLAGFTYGSKAGLLISVIAALLGCYLTVRLSQRFLYGWASSRFPQMISFLDRLLKRDLFLKVLVLRLQPLGTNLLTNICIGFTRVSRAQFLFASAVGFIPQMMVFSLLGAGVRVGSFHQTLLSVVLLFVSLVLGVILYRRYITEFA